jgi:hypothetical protein
MREDVLLSSTNPTPHQQKENAVLKTLVQQAAPAIDYGQAPPGSDKFLQIVGYAGWAGLAIAVVGFVVAGIMMVVSSSGQHGNSGQMKTLGWVMGGAVVIGTASGWATTLAG